MKNLSRIILAPAAIALMLAACSGEKTEVAKTNNAPSDQIQAQTPSDEMQTQTPSDQMQAQTASDESASSSLDPSAITFTAMDINGSPRQATQWVGRQPVVINFWGTWCPPCRREIPDLVRFYDEYKSKGLEIVSLAVNDNPDAVRAYASNAGMNWVMLMGEDGIYQKYGGIRGVPTTIFLDRTGKEVKRMVGAASYQDFKAAADMII